MRTNIGITPSSATVIMVKQNPLIIATSNVSSQSSRPTSPLHRGVTHSLLPTTMPATMPADPGHGCSWARRKPAILGQCWMPKRQQAVEEYPGAMRCQWEISKKKSTSSMVHDLMDSNTSVSKFSIRGMMIVMPTCNLVNSASTIIRPGKIS